MIYLLISDLPIKKLEESAKKLAMYAISITSTIVRSVEAAKPDITPTKTTPGITTPIKAKDSTKAAAN